MTLKQQVMKTLNCSAYAAELMIKNTPLPILIGKLEKINKE
jgi:hypothetical protein